MTVASCPVQWSLSMCFGICAPSLSALQSRLFRAEQCASVQCSAVRESVIRLKVDSPFHQRRGDLGQPVLAAVNLNSVAKKCVACKVRFSLGSFGMLAVLVL